MDDRVETQLKALPAKPGVYLFRDADGEVLYVGKAKSLRPRVRSYFQKTAATGAPRSGSWPARVADVEVIVTGSEVEALHLEQNLVKRHRPPFNVRLRDDKSFPYIAVTVEDEYPRVMFTRERHRPRRLVLRPVREREEGARDARRAQPRLPVPARARGRSRAGTAASRASTTTSTAAWRPASATSRRRTTAAIVDGVIEFLSGETRADPARARAADAGGGGRGALRGRGALPQPAVRVQHLVERQAVEQRSVGTVDVIGFAAEGDRAGVQIFPLRGGKMVDRYSFHLENVGGQDVTTMLESFGLEYYGRAPSVPPQIVVPRDAGDMSALDGVPLRAARRARRGARGRARREAAAAASSPTRTRCSRSQRRSRRASSGGCAASRRSRSCARR